jgi:hypothetical protein
MIFPGARCSFPCFPTFLIVDTQPSRIELMTSSFLEQHFFLPPATFVAAQCPSSLTYSHYLPTCSHLGTVITATTQQNASTPKSSSYCRTCQGLVNRQLHWHKQVYNMPIRAADTTAC